MTWSSICALSAEKFFHPLSLMNPLKIRPRSSLPHRERHLRNCAMMKNGIPVLPGLAKCLRMLYDRAMVI